MTKCCKNCEFVFEDADGIFYCDKCNEKIEDAECGWYKIELASGSAFGMYSTLTRAIAAINNIGKINRENETIYSPMLTLITPENDKIMYYWTGESFTTDISCFNFHEDED